MKLVADQLRRLVYRAGFYLDVRGLVQLLKFRQLRDSYFKKLWMQAAQNVGAEYKDMGFGFAGISRNGLTTFVRESNVMLDDKLTLDIMGNKALVYKLLAGNGYSIPKHRRFSLNDLSACEAFFESHNGAVVVKPGRGTGGGRGVTTGVNSLKALRKAFRYAARYDSELLVEEQLEGHSYRLLYLDGKFIDAVRRDPPVIIGDGRSTIRKLVSLENKKRLSGDPVTALSPLKIDRDCQNKLRQLGLRPGSRLKAGQVVALKRAVNENCSLKNYSVRDQVHPQTVQAGERLARDFGVKFAGLDVICKDISKPLETANGTFGEVNTTPGIHHHYLVNEATASVPVAELVLDYMFREKQGVMRLKKDQTMPVSIHGHCQENHKSKTADA